MSLLALSPSDAPADDRYDGFLGRYGYVPGDADRTCRACVSVFTGDNFAETCRRCAVEAHQRRLHVD